MLISWEMKLKPQNKLFVRIISVLFVSCIIFSSCKNKEKIIIQNQSGSIPGLNYDLNIPEYPEYEELSKKVADFFQKDFERYKDFATVEWEASQEDTFSYRTVALDYSDKDYVNVFVKKYLYCGPGIEDEYYLTFCWDKKAKKLLTVSEVTGMNEFELCELCRKEVKNNLKKSDLGANEMSYMWVDSSIYENPSVFSSFTVTKTAVTIYFAPGSAAPKGYGMQTVVIPR